MAWISRNGLSALALPTMLLRIIPGMKGDQLLSIYDVYAVESKLCRQPAVT